MTKKQNVPTCILDYLFLGSKVDARNKELLEKLKITHILNVTPPKTVDPFAGVPNFFEKEKKIIYRRCSIFDNNAEDITMSIEGCIAFIDQAKYYGRILVHCNKGISRSSSMVIAYLMKTLELSFDEALEFVVNKRPIANPNESFRKQLQAFGRRIASKTSSPSSSISSSHVQKAKQIALCKPSLPSSSQVSSPSEKQPASLSKRSSIGPQLPPSQFTNVQSSKPETSTVTPTPSSTKKRSIGPQLPTPMSSTPKLKKQKSDH